MPSLSEYLDIHAARIRDSTAASFSSRHEAFVAGLNDFSAGDLDATHLACHADFFRAAQRRYLAQEESRANANMVAESASHSASKSKSKSQASIAVQRPDDRFANASYQRVNELLVLCDIGACRRMVMVGCGAFPATLLWFSDHFPALDCIGIDIDPECVARATRLAESLGRRNLRFAAVDGCAFDYTGAEFVYVANQVAPKAAVLERIVHTSPPRLDIVVREPVRLGELLADAARSRLPAGLSIRASGPVSTTFLSYDLVLSADRER